MEAESRLPKAYDVADAVLLPGVVQEWAQEVIPDLKVSKPTLGPAQRSRTKGIHKPAKDGVKPSP